jgi:glycosyltransferase involved in cell wall biosynthesis
MRVLLFVSEPRGTGSMRGIGGPHTIAASLFEPLRGSVELHLALQQRTIKALEEVATGSTVWRYGGMFNSESRKRLLQMIEEVKPSVILSTGSIPLDFHVSRAAKAAAIPHIIHRHICWRDETGSLIKRLLLLPIENYTLKNASRVMFSSANAMRKTMAHSAAARIKGVVLHNPIDLNRFKPSPRVDRTEIRVGMVAQFTALKGWPVFFEAMQDAMRADNRLRAYAYGNGPLWEEMKLRYGTDKTILMGNRENMHLEYPGLDIFVLSSYREGLSQACVEACACGLPIVVTDVAGSDVLVKDGVNGFLVKKGNPKELAARIVDLATNESRRASFGRESRKKAVELFDQAKVCRKFEEILFAAART